MHFLFMNGKLAAPRSLFDQAKIHGSEGANPFIGLHRQKNQKQITARLQGIHASELHYLSAALCPKGMGM